MLCEFPTGRSAFGSRHSVSSRSVSARAKRIPARLGSRFECRRVVVLGSGAPAGEQADGVGGCGAGFGGEDCEAEAVGRQLHDFVGQIEVADDGVVEAFCSGLVVADVVGGPPLSEWFASSGEFAYEVAECAVVRVSAGLGAEVSDEVSGGVFPVDEELLGGRIEEREAGAVGRLFAAVEEWRVEGSAERVGCEVVAASVAERGGSGDRVEDVVEAGPDALWRGSARASWCAGVGNAGEVEQVGSFGVVQLESVGERVEHGVRDAGGVAAFEPLVVLEADAGEGGDLLAAQPLYPPGAVGGKADLVGCEAGPACSEELGELGGGVHGAESTSAGWVERGPASTPLTGPATRGSAVAE